MSTHLEQELENIRRMIFQMADLSIEAIVKSVDSLKKRDLKLAEQIIHNDSVLDRLEIDIDEECIRVLVTKQPAAVDLRFVLSMLKINTDLERIGDLASNIAAEAIRLNGQQLMKPLVDIPRMGSIAVEMINSAFQSITGRDVAMAKAVIEMDTQMDQ
jgi:phosphate transport system protein